VRARLGSLRVHLFLGGFIGGWLDYLMKWFTQYHYIAPFVVLLSCGLGAPLPEEVTLIGCGFLVHTGDVKLIPISIVCAAAILLGDSIPYWLGRHYGLAALKTRWVAKILHPERFAKLERRFEDNKNWSIFTCRFLPGLRIPGYFVAGTLRMSFTRFIVLDSLGVLLSVPTSIYVASIVFKKVVGDDDDFSAAGKSVSRFNHFLLMGIGLLVFAVLLRSWIKHRKKEDVAEESPSSVIDPMIDERRYADALALIPDLDAHVGALVLKCESDLRRIEAEHLGDEAAMVEARRRDLRHELAHLYEALLAGSRLDDAGRLADRAFGIDGHGGTYTAFLQAAKRARAPAAARSVAGSADRDPRLSEDDKERVRSAAREIVALG
jgi:membrane protein DedA with SNARE-associated domain